MKFVYDYILLATRIIHIHKLPFIDIYFVLNVCYGPYPYIVNPAQYFSLQTYLLKNSYRRSLLVPFSLAFVLLGDYFYFDLHLSAAKV